MSNKKHGYRVHLCLSESEAAALSRLGKPEFRSLRTQAHYLIRRKLIELNMLPDDRPVPVDNHQEG